MSNQSVIDLLAPVIARVRELNLDDPDGARVVLNTDYPADGKLLAGLAQLATAGLAEGWLCNKESGGTRFSRVAKPEAAHGFSIDAVLLSSDGPAHRHTRGEVNCLLPLEGAPKFCGIKPPWAVFAPGSRHVPSVAGGKMLIFYMLPGGAIEWK